MPKTTKKNAEKAAEPVPKHTKTAYKKTAYMLKMANGKSRMVIRRRRVPLPKKIRDKLERIFTEKVFPRGKGTMKARQEYMRKLANLELRNSELLKKPSKVRPNGPDRWHAFLAFT